MGTTPNPADQMEDYVSAAARPENVGRHGSQEEVRNIVALGPRGALTVAALAVAMLLAIWIAFFFFVFLARGAVD
jgi:hypothetical protein